MEPIKETNVAPGTEGAPHTGLVEPHSPAAEALANHGASGVISSPSDPSTRTVGTSPVIAEAVINATSEMVAESNPLPKSQHPNDVKFKVGKATGAWAKDSVQIVSKESAEQFEKGGLGKIVK